MKQLLRRLILRVLGPLAESTARDHLNHVTYRIALAQMVNGPLRYSLDSLEARRIDEPKLWELVQSGKVTISCSSGAIEASLGLLTTPLQPQDITIP